MALQTKIRTIFIAIITLFSQKIISQDFTVNNSTIYLSSGLVTIPDMTRNENGFTLGLGYRRRINKTFSAEIFFQRSAANSTLPFFENKPVLADYLIENDIGIPTDFSKVATNAIGLKIHFAFINKPKNYFSFAIGYGFFGSKSTVQRFVEFSIDQNGEISDFEVLVDSENRNKSFVMPSLIYTRKFFKTFGAGLELNAFFEQSGEGIITTPVLPNYYSVNLMIIKTF